MFFLVFKHPTHRSDACKRFLLVCVCFSFGFVTKQKWLMCLAHARVHTFKERRNFTLWKKWKKNRKLWSTSWMMVVIKMSSHFVSDGLKSHTSHVRNSICHCCSVGGAHPMRHNTGIYFFHTFYFYFQFLISFSCCCCQFFFCFFSGIMECEHQQLFVQSKEKNMRKNNGESNDFAQCD